MISQDHMKLDSDMIAQHIDPMIRANPSFKVKLVIAEIQSQYGYKRTYWEAWTAKQKAIERVYGSWEGSYEILMSWLGAMCSFVRGSIAQINAESACHGIELLSNVRLFQQLFWAFRPCIKAF